VEPRCLRLNAEWRHNRSPGLETIRQFDVDDGPLAARQRAVVENIGACRRQAGRVEVRNAQRAEIGEDLNSAQRIQAIARTNDEKVVNRTTCSESGKGAERDGVRSGVDESGEPRRSDRPTGLRGPPQSQTATRFPIPSLSAAIRVPSTRLVIFWNATSRA